MEQGRLERSAVYLAAPVTLSRASLRLTLTPSCVFKSAAPLTADEDVIPPLLSCTASAFRARPRSVRGPLHLCPVGDKEGQGVAGDHPAPCRR